MSELENALNVIKLQKLSRRALCERRTVFVPKIENHIISKKNNRVLERIQMSR
jgi:hypothetical protein